MLQSGLRRLQTIQRQLRYSKVQSTLIDRVGVIEMNSASDLNALSTEMKKQLTETVKKFQINPQVKVMVLLSSVQKAFCAGANIKDFVNKRAEDFDDNDIFKEIHDTFNEARKPILAGVNGVALGGGFQLALLCDVILCAENASFGLPELQLGLIPGIGGTQRLAKLIGRVNAMRYILTSERIPAAKAKQFGFVTQIYPTANLKLQVLKMAQIISSKSDLTLKTVKKLVKETENLSMKDGINLQRRLFYPLFSSEGAKEGINAFIEKRPSKLKDL